MLLNFWKITTYLPCLEGCLLWVAVLWSLPTPCLWILECLSLQSTLLLGLTSQFLPSSSTLDCTPQVSSRIPLTTRMITQTETLSQTQRSGQNLPETCASWTSASPMALNISKAHLSSSASPAMQETRDDYLSGVVGPPALPPSSFFFLC